MPSPPANLDEISELLGHADRSLVQEVVETGASIDEIGAALDDLEDIHRFGDSRVPESSRIAQLRRILEPLYAESGHDGTYPIGGVPI
jgi:hypothetical protein